MALLDWRYLPSGDKDDSGALKWQLVCNWPCSNDSNHYDDVVAATRTENNVVKSKKSNFEIHLTRNHTVPYQGWKATCNEDDSEAVKDVVKEAVSVVASESVAD